MGNCMRKRPVIEGPEDVEYVNPINLQIRSPANGPHAVHQTQSFTVTSPICQRSDIYLAPNPIKVTGCVLPGQQLYITGKRCQDSYSYLFAQNILLCVLFDGHGPVGEEVSTFCTVFARNYFLEKIQDFAQNPKEALISLLEECETALDVSKINMYLSGSTAVLVLIDAERVHTASLGDSRAVLACLSDTEFSVPLPKNVYCRKFNVGRRLRPVLLTVDHKPHHEEERQRIVNAGGIVDRASDHKGSGVGAFRVWKAGTDLPGLAMSRSIGDSLAKTCGVISTPAYHSFIRNPTEDQYIIIASDGLWDVMSNIEVAVFVEKFHEKCDDSLIGKDYPANRKNSTIARLLCEEARYRWLWAIEMGDGHIDDISCIVVDFSRFDTIRVEATQD